MVGEGWWKAELLDDDALAQLEGGGACEKQFVYVYCKSKALDDAARRRRFENMKTQLPFLCHPEEWGSSV